MLRHIKENVRKAQNNNREQHIYGNKLVYLKDQLPYGFDLNYVLRTVEDLVPSHMVHNIDSIYVGNFDNFNYNGRNYNAAYENGALYISNDQDDENDMVDDIIHEIAHAVEEQHGKRIYGDSSIQNEFLGKRERLYHLLDQEGFNVSYNDTMDTEYNEKFDQFLYKTVGYPTLTSLTMGLFYSPYAATSTREYFANGFENYFLRDRNYLKKVSPMLYNNIAALVEERGSQS
tara:strand:+ start:728 stop:1420 length:693 start_codon:yes stop_codon:yes gene_type:complete